MQKVKILKKNKLGSRGQIVVVTNNIAHGLIEAGLGKIFKASNKMMSAKKYKSKRKKGYSIK